MLKASQMMNKNYLTITPDMGVDELARLFSRKHISGAVVVNKKGKLLGVVTESDLIAKEKNLHLPTVVSIFDAVIYFTRCWPARLMISIPGSLLPSNLRPTCQISPP